MKPAAEILRTLRSLRRRMALGDFLRSAARAAHFFFGVLLVFTAVAWRRGGFRPDVAAIPVMFTWPFVFGGRTARKSCNWKRARRSRSTTLTP